MDMVQLNDVELDAVAGGHYHRAENVFKNFLNDGQFINNGPVTNNGTNNGTEGGIVIQVG
jgi:hypothetical protein